MSNVKKWNYNQNLRSKTDWFRYYGEYSSAINILLERSDQSQATVLCLPTLFLIRHALELAFKMNLFELEKLSGEVANVEFTGKNAHVLHKLHEEFERQVRLIFKKSKINKEIKKDFNIRNNELKRFRVIFDKLDNWSYAFRYPVKNDGTTKSFGINDEINVAEIVPVYNSVQIILKYTTDILNAHEK